MGNTESSEGDGEKGLMSMDGYMDGWWGGRAAEGVGAPPTDEGAVQAAFALVEEPPGARTLGPPRELDFADVAVAGETVTMNSDALAVQSEWGAAEEDMSSDASERRGGGAEEEEEMSRLVGRDGYLLPFATNAYHMHKVAQLHHLHHEDVGLNEHLVDDIRPNENTFFRPPREGPGWIVGGRYLGQMHAKQAVQDLQAREQARARKQRSKLQKQTIDDAKKLEMRKKRLGSATLHEDFERIAKFVLHERSRSDEANIDGAARGMVAPSREASMHFSLDKLEDETKRWGRRTGRWGQPKKLTDEEVECLRSRYIALHEVRNHPSDTYPVASAALEHEGHMR